MHVFREVSIVQATPDEVWRFFVGMDREEYLSWHPHDHLDFCRMRAADGPLGQGQVVHFKERIGLRTYSFSCSISDSVPSRYVEYVPRRPLNHLKFGRGYFRLSPADNGCTEVEAVVELGWRNPLLDRLLAAIIDIPALRRHMQEEGLNLAAAARGKATPPPGDRPAQWS